MLGARRSMRSTAILARAAGSGVPPEPAPGDSEGAKRTHNPESESYRMQPSMGQLGSSEPPPPEPPPPVLRGCAGLPVWPPEPGARTTISQLPAVLSFCPQRTFPSARADCWGTPATAKRQAVARRTVMRRFMPGTSGRFRSWHPRISTLLRFLPHSHSTGDTVDDLWAPRFSRWPSRSHRPSLRLCTSGHPRSVHHQPRPAPKRP